VVTIAVSGEAIEVSGEEKRRSQEIECFSAQFKGLNVRECKSSWSRSSALVGGRMPIRRQIPKAGLVRPAGHDGRS